MPVHIEQIVTEVVAEPEAAESGHAADSRFIEQAKIEVQLLRMERLRRRLAAEGFDD